MRAPRICPITRHSSPMLILTTFSCCLCRREDTTKEKYHYSLTWTCDFPNEDDTYYFAHCYPYTYSDLQVCLLNSKSFTLKISQSLSILAIYDNSSFVLKEKKNLRTLVLLCLSNKDTVRTFTKV